MSVSEKWKLVCYIEIDNEHRKGTHLIFFYKKMETPIILIFISFSFPNLILVNVMVPSLFAALFLINFFCCSLGQVKGKFHSHAPPHVKGFSRTLYNWYQYLWKCTNHWLLTLFTPKLVTIIVISSWNPLQVDQ